MLSVVLIAWNEEKDIARAINSVKQLAGEVVVVVDEATTDRTAEVAKKLGAKIFTHPHTGIVEPMRNFSLSKATGDWILLLDADEEVPPSLAKKIKELIKDTAVDYYRLPRKNIIFGKWITSDHWWPDYIYRLFRRGAITWEPEAHSIPITHGHGRDLSADENLSLIHHHYTSVSQYIERLNRYTDHQADYLLGKGYLFSKFDLINKPISEFLTHFFARGGYRDGIHGLALAGLQTFSELVLYLKLWQKNNFPESHIRINEVTKQFQLKSQEYRWWEYQTRIINSPIWLQFWLKLVRKLGL